MTDRLDRLDNLFIEMLKEQYDDVAVSKSDHEEDIAYEAKFLDAMQTVLEHNLYQDEFKAWLSNVENSNGEDNE